jgi:serine protease Do
MHKEIFKLKVRTWVAALAMVGLVGTLGAASMYGTTGKSEQKAAHQGTSYAQDLSTAFRETAERVLPAVVMIKHTPAVVRQSSEHKGSGEAKQPNPFGGMENGPFGDLFRNNPELRRFFKEMPSMPSIPSIPHHQGVAMGSGVIIDPAGIILTNNHVVAGGGEITVRLHDGREFQATAVKTDPKTDLAIVRIKADHLTAAPLGNSDQVQVGDWVLALGEPFGLEGSVTAGIISAKGRGLGITARENFLQTDAAINPGNSGGPLVNLDGQVVGINTAISSRSGGYQGVGFAVPVNLAKWVSRQLIAKGSVRRAYLGVGIQPVTQELAKQFGVKLSEGVLVTEVFPNTPGAKAGLKPGDVIEKFDGKAVSQPRQLQGLVEQAKIGPKYEMSIVRNGKPMKLSLAVAEQPANFGLVRTGSHSMQEPGKPESAASEKLGLEVETLTADVAKQLGVHVHEGVAITSVRSGSPADLAGLEAGMVITQVDRKPVKTAEDFSNVLKKASLAKGVLLLVRSAEGSRFVVLRAAG